ncbi:bifunctional (p)ppGpp synthetase/guanosine-3',5'-bis(diphosphate) 3'-pyrophosphohydrolase [Parvularcula sp. ZS-1/3]|uniref:GTP pyrophosphokinase rsh n=1 Tax=Parvularcula mediterranea TaxID=2732508 RepID=A0A7Y3RN61_9PROT|nr:RelA/SpoT family protein [Parvularcula mediterranea]NNU17131.1 bifunctional (p)ppGpp synthetase/guanosine-3',5'-bis(diphosphate) 3'-pyrophosphohydrolase [Parvularcula mediterranea]
MARTKPTPETVDEAQVASPQKAAARRGSDARAVEPQADAPQDKSAGKTDASVPGPAETDVPPPPIGRAPEIVRQYELVELVRAYDPNLDEDLLNKAYVYAYKAHGNQMRASGDPYFTHPVSVAAILADLKLDPVTIATALLHDVVEDTDVSVEEIRKLFGDEVAMLVDGVTKISTKEMPADVDGAAENFAKFILATCKDVRVLLVKLADRLHNMRTLHHVPKPEKRRRKALETMEIYAPLARIIGIEKFREELEDLSFYYLRPDDYAAITKGLERVSSKSVSDVIALSQTLRTEIEKAGIDAEIYSREKRAFSVWRKMQRKKQLFEELADIYAFRVIVPNEEDCYRVLGVIHRNYRMIPGEFDDYISTPKPNNYRSIHTAVLLSKDKKAQKAEIQIRSKDMHEAAERGIAAHWKYKDRSQRSSGSVELSGSEHYNDYEWLRRTVSSVEAGGNVAELLQTAKLEFYRDQIFCFTPRGRVIGLPSGAVAIDFAYALHTEIGDSYTGAKVNGILRPNRHQLKNGDVVEILRSKDAPIPPGWETFAATGSAKLRLRRRVKELAAKDQHALGTRIIRSAFELHDVPYSPDAVREAAKRMGFRGLKPLMEAVGRLEVADTDVLDQVYPNLRAGQKASRKAIEPGKELRPGAVSIEGLRRGAGLSFCEACRPLPGERIVGVKGDDGRAVVHRIDCQVLADQDEKDWTDLAWRNDPDAAYVVEVVVTVTNRTGAIGHIGSLLAKYDADIHDLNVENREVQFSDLRVEIEVRDARHLANVMTALRGSDFVVSAERSEGLK